MFIRLFRCIKGCLVFIILLEIFSLSCKWIVWKLIWTKFETPQLLISPLGIFWIYYLIFQYINRHKVTYGLIIRGNQRDLIIYKTVKGLVFTIIFPNDIFSNVDSKCSITKGRLITLKKIFSEALVWSFIWWFLDIFSLSEL